MIKRGPIQLRGWIRWRLRRARLRAQADADAMDKLPVVFGNAIPKNGSKLLFNVLRGLTHLGPFVDTGLNSIKPYLQGEPTPPAWIAHQLASLRPGDLRFGYLHATPENLESVSRPGWAVFQILRDPRDSLISAIFYATDIHPGHGLRQYYKAKEDMEARITAAIQGINEDGLRVRGIDSRYAGYLDWLEHPGVCVVRFERLVSEPDIELGRILDRLAELGFEPAAARNQAVEILRRQMDPRKSETFRKGVSGNWREHFTARNIAEFKSATGDLLIRLGYEYNADW